MLRQARSKAVALHLVLASPASIADKSNRVSLFAEQFAYSGLAADDSPGRAAFYSLAAGGHAINADNGVYMIDLMRDRPQWTTVIPPSSAEIQAKFKASAVDLVNWVPHYSDGKPASNHTYYLCHVLRKHDLVIRVPNKAGPNQATDGFRLSDPMKWLPAGTLPALPDLGRYQLNVASCCRHPVTEDIYYANQTDYRRFDADKRVWVDDLAQYFRNALWGYRGSIIDAKRNRWVQLLDPGQNRGSVEWFDLRLRNLGGLKGANPGWGNHCGLLHDTHNDLYWACNSDGKVYTIHPDTGVHTYKFTLPDPNAGPCNRFAYFPTLDAIAYVTARHNAIVIPTR